MLTFTGWLKLNGGNLFPGQSPRRFFEPDRENLNTSSMGPYEDWPNGGGVVFLHDFSSVDIIWEIWTPLDQIHSGQKTEVRPRDGHVEHVCKISGSIS